MNADLFSFDAGSTTPGTLTITWEGGTFDIRDQRNSTSIPNEEYAPATDLCTVATTDAFSIRGTREVSGTATQKVTGVTICDIAVVGSDGDWRTAGGDSGIFVADASNVLIEDSTVTGIRDATIYLSADGVGQGIGGNFTVRGVPTLVPICGMVINELQRTSANSPP